MMELRCDSKKHGELIVPGEVIEVKCDSRFCGAKGGVIVLHKFDVHSGELLDTNKYNTNIRRE